MKKVDILSYSNVFFNSFVKLIISVFLREYHKIYMQMITTWHFSSIRAKLSAASGDTNVDGNI